jgi:hypothetical protein
MSATEIPTRMETRLATKARAIQALATSHTFDSTSTSSGQQAQGR